MLQSGHKGCPCFLSILSLQQTTPGRDNDQHPSNQHCQINQVTACYALIRESAAHLTFISISDLCQCIPEVTKKIDQSIRHYKTYLSYKC